MINKYYFYFFCTIHAHVDNLSKYESGKSIWIALNSIFFTVECTPLSNYEVWVRINDIYELIGMLIEATARDTHATGMSCIIKRFRGTVHNTWYLEQICIAI